MTKSAENLNKWAEVTKDFDPMYARSLLTSWAANYDFDDDPDKYIQVFIAVKRYFYIDFSLQSMSPVITYVDKLSIASRKGFSKAYAKLIIRERIITRHRFPMDNFEHDIIREDAYKDIKLEDLV